MAAYGEKPVLLYGLEACPLTKSDLQSLDFLINRFFMKLFTTKSIETVKYCQEYFDLSSFFLKLERVYVLLLSAAVGDS